MSGVAILATVLPPVRSLGAELPLFSFARAVNKQQTAKVVSAKHNEKYRVQAGVWSEAQQNMAQTSELMNGPRLLKSKLAHAPSWHEFTRKSPPADKDPLSDAIFRFLPPSVEGRFF
jgi:hypothetical protein